MDIQMNSEPYQCHSISTNHPISMTSIATGSRPAGNQIGRAGFCGVIEASSGKTKKQWSRALKQDCLDCYDALLLLQLSIEDLSPMEKCVAKMGTLLTSWDYVVSSSSTIRPRSIPRMIT
jgi:hypothetical protein